jgi:hypothetical protein
MRSLTRDQFLKIFGLTSGAFDAQQRAGHVALAFGSPFPATRALSRFGPRGHGDRLAHAGSASRHSDRVGVLRALLVIGIASRAGLE